MSSTAYSAELRPEPFLRRLVLASGLLLWLAGIGISAVLPFSAGIRLLLCLAWTGVCAFEAVAVAIGYARCAELSVCSDGSVDLRARDGRQRRARIAAGSIVLARIAWLRLSVDGAPRCAELLRGNSRENEAWRRFQVIWRHIGAAR